jgi:hypothetical protein
VPASLTSCAVKRRPGKVRQTSPDIAELASPTSSPSSFLVRGAAAAHMHCTSAHAHSRPIYAAHLRSSDALQSIATSEATGRPSRKPIGLSSQPIYSSRPSRIHSGQSLSLSPGQISPGNRSELQLYDRRLKVLAKFRPLATGCARQRATVEPCTAVQLYSCTQLYGVRGTDRRYGGDQLKFTLPLLLLASKMP